MARFLRESWEWPGRVFLICSPYLASSTSSFLIFSSTLSPLLLNWNHKQSQSNEQHFKKMKKRINKKSLRLKKINFKYMEKISDGRMNINKTIAQERSNIHNIIWKIEENGKKKSPYPKHLGWSWEVPYSFSWTWKYCSSSPTSVFPFHLITNNNLALVEKWAAKDDQPQEECGKGGNRENKERTKFPQIWITDHSST